ncbi:hypothetical protein LC087_18185 [Bacillus carboniphilus]|uniref:Type VII secretion effector n=1 Tax=Bacillus carboniphilus TaxID=86663 RepID=A0ABY9JVZ6_9BACI|nr:hypothetical protein [Bacillus carboniphilus]WLR42585.1 hypothetical protein LC087_18185 [Bacillus carboniphilus]
MGNQDIHIDLNELKAALNTLKQSINDFSSYTTNFRSSTRGELKSFNSDFIQEVDALLDNMGNDSETHLLKNVEAIYQSGGKLAS